MHTEPFKFWHLIGDGTGHELAEALYRLFKGIGLNFVDTRIEKFRLENGHMDPAILTSLKKLRYGLKGSTRTDPDGPPSVNVALRRKQGFS